MTIMTDTKEQQKRSQNHYWEIAAFNSYSGRIIYDYFFLVFFLAHDDEKKYSWLRRFTTFPFLISLLLLPTYPQLTGTRMGKNDDGYTTLRTRSACSCYYSAWHCIALTRHSCEQNRTEQKKKDRKKLHFSRRA